MVLFNLTKRVELTSQQPDVFHTHTHISAEGFPDRTRAGSGASTKRAYRRIPCGCSHLAQSVGVGGHIGQDHQNVQIALVRQVLGRRQGQPRRDDALDRRVIREVKEERRALHRAALLEIVAEKSSEGDSKKAKGVYRERRK